MCTSCDRAFLNLSPHCVPWHALIPVFKATFFSLSFWASGITFQGRNSREKPTASSLLYCKRSKSRSFAKIPKLLFLICLPNFLFGACFPTHMHVDIHATTARLSGLTLSFSYTWETDLCNNNKGYWGSELCSKALWDGIVLDTVGDQNTYTGPI